MDGQRFDDLALAIAASTSRRKALCLLGGGAIGGIFALLGRQVGGQVCLALGEFCEANEECCALVCDPAAKVCACPQGLSPCKGECVDLHTDPNHCGSCLAVCQPGATCLDGDCVCDPSLLDCGGQCVDPAADPAHCGGCDIGCGADEVCCLGDCVAVKSDPTNCGACGNACAAEQSCVDGTCLCPLGLTLCGDRCVSIFTDPANCGSCGHVCPAGEACDLGVCAGGCHPFGGLCGGDADCCFGVCLSGACGCPVGTVECSGECLAADLAVLCGGVCVSRLSFELDENNCGGCGNVCAPDQSCCGGTCVDPLQDRANCGSCGNVCGPDEVCAGGACECATGLIRCDEACVNTSFDPANCGACGNACAGQQACLAGECVRLCQEVGESCDPFPDLPSFPGAPPPLRCCTGGTCVVSEGRGVCVNRDEFFNRPCPTGYRRVAFACIPEPPPPPQLPPCPEGFHRCLGFFCCSNV